MNTEEIRKLMTEDKLFVGVSQAEKAIDNGGASRVLIANNAPAQRADEIRARAEMAGVEVIELDVPNHKLGTMCREQHAISFLTEKK